MIHNRLTFFMSMNILLIIQRKELAQFFEQAPPLIKIYARVVYRYGAYFMITFLPFTMYKPFLATKILSADSNVPIYCPLML